MAQRRLGRGTLSSGVATYTVTSIAAGSHSYTAVYGGSSTYATSTSLAVPVTALTATTTTLAASSTSPATGSNITLTATVASSSATGTVTFKDGSTTLGTGTLSTGVAIYTVNSITLGSHSYTAVFGGNSTYATSTSSVVPVTAVSAGAVVSLSSQYNITGIGTVGTAPPNGGIDGYSGKAFNSATLGTSVNYGGQTFTFGPVNAPDAINGLVVSLPAGTYNQVNVIGASVGSVLPDSTFTVTYTDGTITTDQQNSSLWTSPADYTGETTLLTAANQLSSSGSCRGDSFVALRLHRPTCVG